jgi:hypothetical protein
MKFTGTSGYRRARLRANSSPSTPAISRSVIAIDGSVLNPSRMVIALCPSGVVRTS